MINKTILITLALLAASFGCRQNHQSTSTPLSHKNIEIRGVSFVAPPEPFPTNPMPALQQISCDWIATIPYGFTKPGQNKVIFHEKNDWQWWGESPIGVTQTIETAHEALLKVMLKPQVYFPGSWSGFLDFEKEEDWQSWEADYTRYIMTFVKIANAQSAEAFCIGTEFKISVVKREAFWRKLIKNIRNEYKGKLTYAANWDEYAIVPFWDELDYIGINAYFPLINEITPSVEQLCKVWKTPLDNIEQTQQKFQKPVIFTEYGYLSVDRCAYNSWELESNITERIINEQAQANAIEALWKTCSQRKWWVGGFIWKWFPNMQGHEGYPERDYTPQQKTGETVLKKCHEMGR